MKRPKGYPKITVLICALNEAESLPYVLPKIPSWVDEVLLVDGHSCDGTVEVVKKIRPEIKILCQPGKGKGDALKYGVQQATGDIVVTLDADGETDSADIPRFIEPLILGADFAKGTRLTRGSPQNMPWHRWVGNKILTITCNILSGSKYTDVCSGYNAFWKRAFLRLNVRHSNFEMEQEMLVRAKKLGLRVIEVEHQTSGRLNGKSKVSDVKQGLFDLTVIIKECLRPG